MPKAGQKAPDFMLKDQHGNIHSLEDYRGKWVLLYFYPKDSTPGCTVEAQVLRDSFSAFKKLDCIVLGVSADTEDSHRKFSEKQKLPFPLLVDIEKEAILRYGVWAEKKFMGRKFMGILRTSFLIDQKGTIAKVYESVKPAKHGEEVLEDLRSLQQ